MIANIWGVMAGTAKTGNALLSKYIIESHNTCNIDLCTVENRLSTCDRQAILIDATRSRKVGPGQKKLKIFGVNCAFVGFPASGSPTSPFASGGR